MKRQTTLVAFTSVKARRTTPEAVAPIAADAPPAVTGAVAPSPASWSEEFSLDVDPTWRAALEPETRKPSFQALIKFLRERSEAKAEIYPPREDVFRALRCCGLPDVRVVILGQDPYHQPGQAHGFCFSVRRGTPVPPSLRNMYKELQSDLGIAPSKEGDLTFWNQQGVLLLNTLLTVERGKPMAHASHGWEAFTDEVLRVVSRTSPHAVFLLWGNPSKRKLPLVDKTKHTVLQAAHVGPRSRSTARQPSPLSANTGFFGCKHFSLANEALKKHGQTPIDWDLSHGS